MAAAPATASAAPEVAPPAIVAAPTGLGAKILKQGKPSEHVATHLPVLGKPGKYRVSYGSLTLGYEADDTRIVAHPGAVVHLSAEDAGPLMLAKTVERLEEQ